MISRNPNYAILFFVFFFLGGNSPQGWSQAVLAPEQVIIRTTSDPEKLNPVSSTSALSIYIHENLCFTLMNYDLNSLEFKPQIAAKPPVVEALETGKYAGGMSITFEIHPKATWDNGTPIQASDYIFTIKTVKTPGAGTDHIMPYYEFIDDIQIDAENPKKFTIFSKERYFLATEFSGILPLIPEYIYDPKGLLKEFPITKLNNPKQVKKLSKKAAIQEFNKDFNGDKFNKEIVSGAGPYKLIEWSVGNRIVLERKTDWWGDKVKDNPLLDAYSKKLIYKVIPDNYDAEKALRAEEIDVMTAIPSNVFEKLQEDAATAENYEFSTPTQFSYHYIGINCKNEKLQDKRVRRALAHLVDRDEIINSLYDGAAVKLNSPINPSKKYYADKLPSIDLDLDKARELFKEAGWKDLDGDGILDKKINGKTVAMKLQFKYNAENDLRHNIGLFLKDQAKLVGVEIELEATDWRTFFQDIQDRDFELMGLAWVLGPGLDDFKQTWHTESSKKNGSNYVNFGTPKSDQMIDELRTSLDEENRNRLYKEIQKIIHDEQPYIFLFVPREKIAVHNRFKTNGLSPLRPGYRARIFEVKPSNK